MKDLLKVLWGNLPPFHFVKENGDCVDYILQLYSDENILDEISIH